MARQQLFDPERVEVDHSLTRREAKRLATEPALKVIQTVGPLPRATWELLDEQLFARRHDVQLRLYGHYREDCDLRITKYVPHVRHLAADSLQTSSYVEAIADLPMLETLSLGIYDLDSFAVLERLPADLQALTLGQTRSKKPDLGSLARFSQLRTVYIEGHTRGIAALGGLTTLEDVTLRSTTTPNLDFLKPLVHMWTLDIKLGGTTNLSAIAGMPGIKYLELWQIRALRDLGVISELPGLQNLFLQALPQVAALPTLEGLHHLRRVFLENMKGLIDLQALLTAPALEEFAFVDAQGKDPWHLLPALRNPGVRAVVAGFGSLKKNAEFELLRQEHGKEPLNFSDAFFYR